MLVYIVSAILEIFIRLYTRSGDDFVLQQSSAPALANAYEPDFGSGVARPTQTSRHELLNFLTLRLHAQSPADVSYPVSELLM